MQAYINLFKQDNDHTKIMYKMRFRRSFKAHQEPSIKGVHAQRGIWRGGGRGRRGLRQKQIFTDMGRGGQPNVDVRIEKKNDFQLFIFTIIWKYFQSNINVMSQYSVLDKIRLGCNIYPSSLYTCACTHTHTQTHIHTFYIYYQLTTVACLISISSNLSLIINK